jgi:hypothetical protein
VGIIFIAVALIDSQTFTTLSHGISETNQLSKTQIKISSVNVLSHVVAVQTVVDHLNEDHQA